MQRNFRKEKKGDNHTNGRYLWMEGAITALYVSTNMADISAYKTKFYSKYENDTAHIDLHNGYTIAYNWYKGNYAQDSEAKRDDTCL